MGQRVFVMQAVKAGLAYFGVVFAAGFILGTIRVLLVVPRLGETAAVLVESPAMLAISWLASRWLTRLFDLPNALSPRLLMGVVAFTFLMLAEIGASVFVFGRPVGEHFAAYLSVPGGIGLSAQTAFAFFPSMQRRSS